MSRVLFVLLTAVLLLSPVAGQAPAPWDLPVVTTTAAGDGLLLFHGGDVVSYTIASHEGTSFQYSRSPQGFVSPVSDACPVIKTEWTDKKGACHSVETPVISVSPSGMRKARETHQQLVAMMQEIYPPA